MPSCAHQGCAAWGSWLEPVGTAGPVLLPARPKLHGTVSISHPLGSGGLGMEMCRDTWHRGATSALLPASSTDARAG